MKGKLLAGWPAVDHPVAASLAIGRIRTLSAACAHSRTLPSDVAARANSHASASCSAPSFQASSWGLSVSEPAVPDRTGRDRREGVSRYVRLQSRRRNVSRSADWPVRLHASSGNADRSQSPPPPSNRVLGLGSGIGSIARQNARSDSKAQSGASGAAFSSDPAAAFSQALAAQGPTCRWPGGPTCPWPGGTKAITLDQLSKTNPQTMKALAQSAKEKQPGGAAQPNIGTIWALIVLALAYLHHSTTG